jgi:hypothetical protein
MLDTERREYERIVIIGCGFIIAAVGLVVFIISTLIKLWA